MMQTTPTTPSEPRKPNPQMEVKKENSTRFKIPFSFQIFQALAGAKKNDTNAISQVESEIQQFVQQWISETESVQLSPELYRLYPAAFKDAKTPNWEVLTYKLHKIFVDNPKCSEMVKFFGKDGKETPKIPTKNEHTPGKEEPKSTQKFIPINPEAEPKTMSFSVPSYQPAPNYILETAESHLAKIFPALVTSSEEIPFMFNYSSEGEDKGSPLLANEDEAFFEELAEKRDQILMAHSVPSPELIGNQIVFQSSKNVSTSAPTTPLMMTGSFKGSVPYIGGFGMTAANQQQQPPHLTPPQGLKSSNTETLMNPLKSEQVSNFPTRLAESLIISSGTKAKFGKGIPLDPKPSTSVPSSSMPTMSTNNSAPTQNRLQSQSDEVPVNVELPIVTPFGSYRQDPKTVKEKKPVFQKDKKSLVNLEFFDFFLVENQDEVPKVSTGNIFLAWENILMAIQGQGFYDLVIDQQVYWQVISILSQAVKSVGEVVTPSMKDLSSRLSEKFSHYWTKENLELSLNLSEKSIDQMANDRKMTREKSWTSEKLQKIMLSFVNISKQNYKSDTYNGAELSKLLDQIREEVLLFQRTGQKTSIDKIERLFIALSGFEIAAVREFAAKILNVLYDGHDWQSEEALTPVIRSVMDSFVIEVAVNPGSKQTSSESISPASPSITSTINTSMASFDIDRVFLMTYSPELRWENNLGKKDKKRVYGFSLFKPTIVREQKFLRFEMPTFASAGFYDWRIVELDNLSGKYVPFSKQHLKLSQIQGRVIVHPQVRHETFHEVWVDSADVDWDNTGNFLRRGTFSSITKLLPEYKKLGATSLYVMGALERDTSFDKSFIPSDHTAPNRKSGGIKQFGDLVDAARLTNMKILVDYTTKISAKNYHRKYRGLVASMVDTTLDSISLRNFPGTDGKEFVWNHLSQLNFRKKENWDMVITDVEYWASLGVSGIRIDAAHTWPMLLKSDLPELLKEDNDDQFHYSLEEILQGEVAVSPTEADSYGFYGTQVSQKYPNPIFVKLVRSIWLRFPEFIFLAEFYWGRERTGIASGLIPIGSSLPRATASTFNIGFHKDGSLSYLPEKKNVSVFYDWYQSERTKYPQNAILVNPSSSHFFPYPCSIFGRGAWPHVDLLYFLPEIPATFGNEQSGWMMIPDIHSGKMKYPNISAKYQGDFSTIRGHYEHRAAMRKNYPVLREGGLIPLFACFGNYNWHERVFAFCRFTNSKNQEGPELAIVAINFNEYESIFYIDCSPLKEIVENTGKIYRVTDLINPSNAPQFFERDELLFEKNFVRLPPYGSLCWGVYSQAPSPTTERVVFEHSMQRLQKNIQNNVDPSFNRIYTSLDKGLDGGVLNFCASLKDLQKRVPLGLDATFPNFLQSALFHMSLNKAATKAKILAYLEELGQNSQFGLNKLANRILQENILGPIVFVTPELGRFSTVGGIGVMVDELTRALAALGVEIHVISPYYNYNRKGKTNYLEAEGIEYVQNVVTYVGEELVEVGVHQGKEKGVNLHFLHNWKFFSTPYHMGSPVHQLQTIVLMAKASLELCCQLRLLPALIITNDWFTALVPAYGKKSGAFGNTFQGVTFFHIVHNLEEGYEGKIFSADESGDMNNVHQLSRELLVDPYGPPNCLNASRCALLSADQWGTVSQSYRDDLMRTSPLTHLLKQFPAPFATLNGIQLHERLLLFKSLARDHEEAKAQLQKKYFGYEDPSIAVYGFVGRIVLQKGVHLILNSIKELMDTTGGKVQVIVGGMANMKDPYAAHCAWSMQALRQQYPKNFWADPNEFFTDGVLLNLGADFGLMPSLFEPSGVVQQEFFAGGTPVIAFKTGGLRDSVFEFGPSNDKGNGFTFEAHTHGDFLQAMRRSLAVYQKSEDYAKLRMSSRACVLDVHTVAVKWLTEYVRLRKRIWAEPSQVEKIRKEILKPETSKLGPPSIKAISFGLGGVLFTEGRYLATEKLSRDHKYSKEILSKIFHSKESYDFKKGLCTDEQFWGWVQSIAPEYDVKLIEKVWLESYDLDNDTVKLIKKLKEKGYKILAISETQKTRLEFLEKKFDFRKLFDHEIYSFAHRMDKFDPKFWEKMIECAGCKPEEVIHVDDSELDARPALELGIHCLRYKNGESENLRKEMSNFGVVDL